MRCASETLTEMRSDDNWVNKETTDGDKQLEETKFWIAYQVTEDIYNYAML